MANGGYCIYNNHFIKLLILMEHDTTTISQFSATVPCPISSVSGWHCLHMSSNLVHAVSRWFAAVMTKGWFSLMHKHKRT